MKEYVLIFRMSNNADFRPTPAQMQEVMTSWTNWMGSIAARDKLVNSGNRLGIKEAKTVMSGNVVTDGPYTEVKEFINGYITIRSNSIEEAVEIAKGCPMLNGGGKVEVRGVVTPEDFSG
ncbi:hypothetical protein CLV51_107155 [Chitinophaga niastensis]|uniref:YCII-related domain-containing protein n=1 Tax=Chitinophaga niastensis TaxID=536980 RepID=A0A2P8HCA6_CHINA|nr:YciI family protein [Chitinophaga niastensis]PSL43844.1 hypothetical protein CLV51_107155 [Chitinophaga niastensis]